MLSVRPLFLRNVFLLGASAIALSACASQGPGPSAMAPAWAPEVPPAIKPQEITGRWGLAAFHKPDDPPAHRGGRAQRLQAALRDRHGPGRRRDDAYARQRAADGAAHEGRARQQDLHRSADRAGRQPAGSRSHVVRWPRDDRCASSIRKCRAATARRFMFAARRAPRARPGKVGTGFPSGRATKQRARPGKVGTGFPPRRATKQKL